MREAGLGLRLAARAGADEEAEGRGPHGGHGLRDDPQPRVQLGEAVVGQDGLSRGRGRGRRAGARLAVAAAARRSRSRPPRPPRPPRPRPRAAAAVAAAAALAGSPVPTAASSSTVLPAISGSSARRRPMRPRSRSTSTTRTGDLVALVEHLLDRRRRAGPATMLEMCSRPSVPLASSTKAPKVVVLTTLPVNSSPTSTSLVIERMRSTRASPWAPVGRVDAGPGPRR